MEVWTTASARAANMGAKPVLRTAWSRVWFQRTATLGSAAAWAAVRQETAQAARIVRRMAVRERVFMEASEGNADRSRARERLLPRSGTGAYYPAPRRLVSRLTRDGKRASAYHPPVHLPEKVVAAERSAGDPLPSDCVLIEVYVGQLKQLFNAMDPSPFREKDLDP